MEFLSKDAAVADADVVAVQFDWLMGASGVLAHLENLRLSMRADARLALLDYQDSATSHWAHAVGACDIYVKAQLPRDVSEVFAVEGTAGVHQRRVCEAVGLPVPKMPTVDAATMSFAAERMKLGWSFGAGDFVVPLLFTRISRRRRPRRVTLPSSSKRHIDVHFVCNVGKFGNDDWYHRHRMQAVDAIAQLPADTRRLCVAIASDAPVGHGSVTQRGLKPSAYRRSFKQSKMVVSPLGYGEICYRDFEAIAAGCVLVKPEMGGVVSEPDLYVADETYLPCRVDFADLDDVVAKALAEPQRLDHIATTARQRLIDYHLRQPWVERFASLVA